MFQKATKKQSKLRMALIGLSGGGKTYTALRIATGLSDKVAVIDTERGSASKYSDIFSFDVLELDSFEPEKYIDAIKCAEKAGYGTVVIDSLSHAWSGTGGLLERVDQIALKTQSKNSYMAWGQITPVHTKLIDAILQARLHVIVTMRTKTEYVLENVNGKNVPRKIGTQPVQRDGMEYEFDVVADIDLDHNMIIGKTRCPAVDGKVYQKPGKEVVDALVAWLTDGAAVEMMTIEQRNTIDDLCRHRTLTTDQRVWLDKRIVNSSKERADDTIEQLKRIPLDQEESSAPDQAKEEPQKLVDESRKENPTQSETAPVPVQEPQQAEDQAEAKPAPPKKAEAKPKAKASPAPEPEKSVDELRKEVPTPEQEVEFKTLAQSAKTLLTPSEKEGMNTEYRAGYTRTGIGLAIKFLKAVLDTRSTQSAA